jgi:hypothetical protein
LKICSVCNQEKNIPSGTKCSACKQQAARAKGRPTYLGKEMPITIGKEDPPGGVPTEVVIEGTGEITTLEALFNAPETYDQWLIRRVKETKSSTVITVHLGYPAGSSGDYRIPGKYETKDLDYVISLVKPKE